MLGLSKGGGGSNFEARGSSAALGQTWKVQLGKLTFGKLLLLGKYPWEVAAWENAYVKVLNNII